jgi:uncharacterized protein (TIGR00255 family)
MVTSMTGHGQAVVEQDQIRVAVEIRTVNNRFLKVSVNSDLGTELESRAEQQVKSRLARGSVSIRIKTTYLNQDQSYRLNGQAIQAYWTQLSEIAGGSQPINVEAILQLPGVIDDSDSTDVETVLPVVEAALSQAIERLVAMRKTEGDAMKVDMLANVEAIETELDQVKERAPLVSESYAKRLTDRINQLLEKFEVSITASDVVKEVGVFADRSDISEETVRLATHLEQFRIVIGNPTPGKKLDFIVQEMLRETNTIGSKANNSDIAKHVVEIKTAIERIREMVQNIE